MNKIHVIIEEQEKMKNNDERGHNFTTSIIIFF